jgi:hypothetical protein
LETRPEKYFTEERESKRRLEKTAERKRKCTKRTLHQLLLDRSNENAGK